MKRCRGRSTPWAVRSRTAAALSAPPLVLVLTLAMVAGLLWVAGCGSSGATVTSENAGTVTTEEPGPRLYPASEDVNRTDFVGTLYGYKDEAGAWVIEPQFLAAGEFSDGLALVTVNVYDGMGDPLRYRYIDKTGAFAFDSNFRDALPFSEGLAAVALPHVPPDFSGLPEYRWGYIDKTGNVVIESQFTDASSFSGGASQVRESGGDPYYIDRTGKKVDPPK